VPRSLTKVLLAIIIVPVEIQGDGVTAAEHPK